MAKNKKKYGYVIALWELVETVPTLFHKVDSYKRTHKIKTKAVWIAMLDPSYLPWPLRPLLNRFQNRDADGNQWNLCYFWSNFEIADIDFFRSTEYRKLFEAFAALLLDPSELHHFADFGYEYAPFRYCPFMLPSGRSPDVIKTEESEGPLVGCRCNCDGDLLFNRPICLDKIKGAI